MTLNLNFDNLKSPDIQQHNPLLPNEHVRCLLTGVSRSGKTQRLMNMLLQPKFLDYNHLILFSPTINQTSYHLLKEGFNNGLRKSEIIDLINNISKYKEDPKTKGITNREIDSIIGDIIEAREELSEDEQEPILAQHDPISVDYYTPNESIENPLPRCESLDPTFKHVFIADDVMNRADMRPVIADYFTNSRHANCSSFYLNQKYTNNDTVIRDNANLILLFRTPSKPIETLYNDYVQSDLDWKVFHNAVNRVFSKPYSFIAIDKTASDMGRKYREGFDKPLLQNPYEDSDVKSLTKKMRNTRLK